MNNCKRESDAVPYIRPNWALRVENSVQNLESSDLLNAPTEISNDGNHCVVPLIAVSLVSVESICMTTAEPEKPSTFLAFKRAT